MPLRVHRSNRRRQTVRLLAILAFVALGVFGSIALSTRDSSSDVNTPRAPKGGANAETDREGQLPSAGQLRSARGFAARRSGSVSFAVVGTSGRLSCYRCRVRYRSASVIKPMLLVAYLNQLAAADRDPSPSHEAHLESMIRVSDNDAASAIYAHVGDERLYRLAREAQMDDFRVSGSWGSGRITAADQARFFARIEVLTAPSYQEYVRDLLSSIVSRQSWGIPEVSRPEWRTYFKGGWLTSARGSLVHQVARLEKGPDSLAIAILTDGNPSDTYGRETVRGITARLLGR